MRHALALALALTCAALPASAQRLPAGVTPEHYTLWFAPDLERATFRARAEIRVRLDQPATAITLHAAEITFGEVTIDTGGRAQPASVTTSAAAETATLRAQASAVAATQARERAQAEARRLAEATEQHTQLTELGEEARHLARLGDLLNNFRNTLVASVGPRLSTQAAELFAELTDREYDILDRIARGLRNEAIAARMGISVKTVQNNVSSILLKLSASDRAHAVAIARDAGLGH